MSSDQSQSEWVDSATTWLSTTNDDGDVTGIDWLRLAQLFFGGWLLTMVTGFARVLGSIGTAAFEATSAYASALININVAGIGAVTDGIRAAFNAPLSLVGTLGPLVAPIGLGIALAALYVWVTLE